MRSVWRFTASVLIVSGALLIADVVVTVLWQEPISALLASREQSRLSGQLNTLTKQVATEERAIAGPSPERLAELARREQRRVGTGHALGRIRLPTLHRSYVMVQGTDEASLRKGPGHYPGTALPGEPGTIGVAGHRTTYLAPFKTIDQLRPGDPVVLEMPYGDFTYRVQTTRIVEPTALWITHDVGYPRLVLSACHPLYSASQRIVVFAKLAAPIEPRSRPASRSTTTTTSASEIASTAIQ
ncbi:MAG TPA: class E sortase [Thermoleophilaceae bacterium]|nr:class E sortase [Thermoleophilaceae bacterium]